MPEAQTCCGQPAWNSGDRETARAIARQVIAAFEGYDYVVVPSGSCAATIAKDYAAMFEPGDPAGPSGRGRSAARTHEITSFLTDVLGVERGRARACRRSRHLPRQLLGPARLGIEAQPRRLLATVEGLELREMAEREVCCGFGGTFCVKYPDISNVMVGRQDRATSPAPAPTWCSRATWAA